MILIDAERLAASRPNRPLFADVSVTISDGDRLGVVGLNGSGKSTLLRMLAGELRPETGEVRWGRGARVGFLLQNPVLPAGTVREAVGGEWQGEAMLDRLGMTPLLDASTAELSGGQAKRAALARLLVGEYEVLILDEPTNHLDLDAIQFLEEWLAAYRGGLVLVTHDRHVLDKVTTQGARTRSRHRISARADGLARRVRVCGIPRRSRRARGTRRGRRTGPQEPGDTRARLVAAWGAGPHVQAEGPDRHRDRPWSKARPRRQPATATSACRWDRSGSDRRASS